MSYEAVYAYTDNHGQWYNLMLGNKVILSDCSRNLADELAWRANNGDWDPNIDGVNLSPENVQQDYDSYLASRNRRMDSQRESQVRGRSQQSSDKMRSEIARLRSRGLTFKAIADALGMSTGSVHYHYTKTVRA